MPGSPLTTTLKIMETPYATSLMSPNEIPVCKGRFGIVALIINMINCLFDFPCRFWIIMDTLVVQGGVEGSRH